MKRLYKQVPLYTILHVMLHCLYIDMGCISAILLYFVSITQDEFVYTEDTTAYNAPYGMA